MAALMLALGAGDALAQHAADEAFKPWSFRYGKCLDERVAGLVGRTVDDALKQVRPMRLVAVRVLDRWTGVNLEVVPERLTLVVHDNGVVVRAFCR